MHSAGERIDVRRGCCLGSLCPAYAKDPTFVRGSARRLQMSNLEDFDQEQDCEEESSRVRRACKDCQVHT